MPNWCETTITFDGIDNEEGKRALEDFYNKIHDALNYYVKKHNNTNCTYHEIFEEMVEEYIVDTMTPLYTYVNNNNKRGYITWMQDNINYNTFSIVCDDAWSPNVEFWDTLIRAFYGDDKISIRYVASEPGMGLFHTNDEGLLPRYRFNFYTQNFKDIMNIPGMFDPSRSYGPFMFLDSSNECLNYTNYNKDMIGFIDCEVEGEEDYVLEYIEECNLGNYDNIEQARTELNKVGDAYVDEFQYVPVMSD